MNTLFAACLPHSSLCVSLSLAHMLSISLALSHTCAFSLYTCRCTLQVARGMSHIHAKGIIHRDLNSRNILLTDNGLAKVASF